MLAKSWILVILVLVPVGLSAQGATLDEGSFDISVNGQRVGTETFAIRRIGTGSGASIVARSRIVRQNGAQEIRTSLQLQGNPPQPTGYEIVVQGDAAQRILARAAGDRFTVRFISPEGERMREYLIRGHAALLDDGIAHQYYFLRALMGSNNSADLTLIIPRLSRQTSAHIAVQGQDDIKIGNRTIAATEYTLQPSGAGQQHFWTDDQGHVLRVSIPDRGFIAQRTAPPG
jgi:hypothetical protein